MRFLVDAQLPPTLARWLTSQGHTAEHVFDHLGGDCTDDVLAALAISTDAIVVSKDSDFLQLQSDGKPRIVWVKIGNSTNRALLDVFEAEWPRVLDALARGEPVAELG